MAREDGRPARVGSAVRRELGEIVSTEVQDPRVSLATITDVELSDDLAQARVFVASLDVVSETDRGGEIVNGLQAAAGFLKKRLGQRLRLRVVPQLRFIEDTTERDAQALDQLIDSAITEDRSHQDDSDDAEDDNPTG